MSLLACGGPPGLLSRESSRLSRELVIRSPVVPKARLVLVSDRLIPFHSETPPLQARLVRPAPAVNPGFGKEVRCRGNFESG